MGVFKYPYTDFHEMNLDWLLRIVRELDLKIDNIEMLQSNYFQNVNSMVKAKVEAGSIAITKGFYYPNDGGEAAYLIVENATPALDRIPLDNGLYAVLMTDNVINVKQLGAVGDGAADDSTPLQYALDNYIEIIIPSTSTGYKITRPLTLTRKGVTVKAIEYDRIGSASDIKPTIFTTDGIAQILKIEASYFNLENITLYGNHAALSGITSKSSHGTYKNVSCVSCVNYGFDCNDYLTIFEQCNAYYNTTNFYIHGGVGFYTSNKLINCYSIDGTNGYILENMTYTSLDTCACDGASAVAYTILGCKGITVISCGTEQSNKSMIIASSDNVPASTDIVIEGFSILSQNGDATSLIDIGVGVDVVISGLFCNEDNLTIIKETSEYAKITCLDDIPYSRLNLAHPQNQHFPYMNKPYAAKQTCIVGGNAADFDLPAGITSDFTPFATVVFGNRYAAGDQIQITQCYMTGANKVHIGIYTNQAQDVTVAIHFINEKTTLL